MAKKIALFISVKETLLDFPNVATQGVDTMANNLQYSLSNAFSNIRMIQNKVKKGRIISSIEEASNDLEPGGFCLIYYHGHGNSVKGSLNDDEPEDQALVCYDGYLIDDELDQLLRSFHSSCRLLTVMDCCSSKTIVEWKFNPSLYPQIMHIASASDNGYALAGPSGGLMSQQIINMLAGWGYANYTYGSFSSELKTRMNSINHEFFVRVNPLFTRKHLNLSLFY